MSAFDNSLSNKLSKRKEDNLLRKLVTREGLIDFCSNDYLGLSRSRELTDLITKHQEKLPIANGATGSRLLSGNSHYTEEAEQQLAEIFQGEGALIFNSGYTANLAVLSSIPQKNDTIIYDELAHACIKDGARLSLANRYSFRHNDLNDLESKIKRASGKVYIAVESIYSMDGDQCPLKELVELATKYDAHIILDEAHSTGNFGKAGSGLSTSLQLHHSIAVRIYTFGKAMGIHGACVVGSETLRNYLINFARPFIYTTALPQHSIVAIRCAFDYLNANIELQDHLNKKINLFLKNTYNIQKTPSESAIQTALFSGNENVGRAAFKLQEKGFDIRPILSPTVPKGTERLRICLHTFNSDEEIENLSMALNNLEKEMI